MKRFFSTTVLIFSGIIFSFGQGIWTAANGPFGGNVNDVVYLTGDVMLAASAGGIYRSTDNGSSWARVTSGINQFDVSFTDLEVDAAGKVYAITYSYLYTSNDSGTSWTKANTTQFFGGRILKVAPDGDLYLATDNQVLRSSNGGVSFANTLYVAGNYITGLQVSALESVFVARQNQSIQKGTNNGTSWSDAGSSGFPAIANHTYRIALDNASPNNLYALTEVGPYKLSTTGSAWTSVKSNLAETNFYGNIFYSSGNLILFNNDVSKMFTSTDGGATWSSGKDYFRSEIIAFTSKSATEFFKIRGTYGVYKSVDAGISWNSANSGIRAVNPRSLLITPNNNRLLIPANDKGYQISLDDGGTWDLVSSGTTDRYIAGMLKLADNSIIAHGEGLIRSGNDATSWTVQNTNGFYSPMAVSGNVLYTLQGTNLMVSTNYGVNWTSTAISGISGNYDKILVDNSGNAYIREWSDNRVYKIPNGSSTATQLSPNANDFTLVGNTLFILSSSTAMQKSIDGGSSFTQTTWSTNNAATKIWAYSDKDIFAMRNQNGKFQISNDGGSSWTTRDLVHTDAFVNDVKWVEKNHLTGGGKDLFLYLAPNSSVVHKSTNGVIPPKAPSNLTLKGTTYNQATIIWDFDITNFNTESFVIESSEGNNTSYSEYTELNYLYPNTLGKWDFPIGGEPGTQLYVKVKGVNSAGSSPYSNELVINFPAQCTSDIPDNRSWTAVATADPGFTATGSSPPVINTAASIRLRAGTVNTFDIDDYLLGIDNTNNNAIIDENCGQIYLAQNGYHLTSSNGTWDPITGKLILKWETTPFYDPYFKGTTEFTLNASDPVPNTPDIQIYLYSGTEVLINWGQTNFASDFTLQRATNAGGPYTTVANITYPSVFYLDKNLTTGATYYYRLLANNATGSSAPSSVKSIQVQNVLFRPVENDIQLNFENQQGVSWGDLDGDGWEDIASPSFVNNAGQSVPPVFYKNLGATNPGQFERKTIAVLANENTAVSRMINIFDFNNDGKLDMYIARSGTLVSDLLLINNDNDWTFTKTIVPTTDNYLTGFRGSAGIDYNKDGYADIFAGQDNSNRAILLRNNNGSSLVDEPIGTVVQDVGLERTISTIDFDNDNDLDIFIFDYANPAKVRGYKNNGDGTFTKITGSPLFDSDLIINMRTASWGDIDNDGDFDLYIGTQPSSIANRLYVNNGNGTFTSASGGDITQVSAAYGSTFGDIDNDGDLDLVSAGFLSNIIFLNDGTGNFTKYAQEEMLTHPDIFSIGIAMCDFDRDGFLDIYPSKGQTNAIDLPNLLYKNTLNPSGSRHWLEVKLVGTASNRSAIGAKVKVVTSSPSRTQIREISARTGYGSANSLIAHFGLGSATIISQLIITWPSGAVQTLNNLTTIDQVLTIEEDVAGPTFTFNPSHNSTSAPIGNKLDITLNENATPVAGKFITIRKTSVGSTPIQTIAVTAGTVNGNTFSYTLSASTEYEKDYFISIDAGAFVDKYQNGSLAVAPTEWTFKTEEAPDLTFPIITFNPNDYISLPKGFGTGNKIVALASDNKSVTSFSMYYRKVTATQYNQVFGSFTSGSSYEYPLLESFFDDMGMEFYFEAKDAAGNTTRSPATGNYRIILEFDDTNTTLSIASGAGANNYQIRSVPFENLPSNEISVLFDELGQPDGTKYRILRYKNNPESWLEYPNGFNSVARGEGYFMLVREGANIKFGSASAPTNSQGNLFTINLVAGWNLIGNPYTVTASWNESIAGLTGVGGLKAYQNGAYVDGNDMPIFSGGFVFADVAQPVSVKLKTSLTGGRSKSEFTSELNQQKWIVPIKLEQAGSEFLLGGIGMHPMSKVTYDDFDDLTPPAINGRLELAFKHPEHFMKVFSKDVVPTADNGEWTFSIISDKEGLATLSWDPMKFGDNSKELMLFDLAIQKVVDMRQSNAYVFDPKASTEFKLYFGEDLQSKILPNGVGLAYPVPNPARETSTISFTLSEQSSTYQVGLEVYDMMGRFVKRLEKNTLGPGFYTYRWDLDKDVANGLYTYRLSVSSNGNSVTHARKVVVNR